MDQENDFEIAPRQAHIPGRLDKVAALLFPEYSRSQLQQLIRSGNLLINGMTQKPGFKLSGGERLAIIRLPDEWTAKPLAWSATAMKIDTLHEDQHLIIVNKPAGMVTHPAPGHLTDTLANGLLERYPALNEVPRAGLVHRLDKDTSGLLLVAMTAEAQGLLIEMLKQRLINRTYLLLIKGRLLKPETVVAEIGRHHRDRKRMAVVNSGKAATTHVKPLRHFGQYTLAEATLDSGRTHQIRVHMAYLGCPLVGDSVYGHKSISRKASATDQEIACFPRQALHATKLSFIHPLAEQAPMAFESPLPEDFARLLELLDIR